MENVYDVLRDHPRPIITTIVHWQRAEKKGHTITAFRDATVTLKEMQLDINIAPTANFAAGSSSAHLASAPTQSFLERVKNSCMAMMSYLSTLSSKPADSSGAAGRGKTTYTPEQQDVYISRSKAQNQAKDQTIRSLQNALTTASGNGGRGRGAGGGRGGRGRGRGRGRGKAQDGEPEVDNTDASGFSEIFMANMQAEVEQQLPTGR